MFINAFWAPLVNHGEEISLNMKMLLCGIKFTGFSAWALTFIDIPQVIVLCFWSVVGCMWVLLLAFKAPQWCCLNIVNVGPCSGWPVIWASIGTDSALGILSSPYWERRNLLKLHSLLLIQASFGRKQVLTSSSVCGSLQQALNPKMYRHEMSCDSEER